MPISSAYLGLGANMGDRLENLRTAVRMLQEEGRCRVVAISPVYETRPVGMTDQPDFLNAVAAVETSLEPENLLDLCLSVEKRMGRERTIRWGPRVIDIDILLYDGVKVATERLTVPHPELVNRAFVIVPLADIAPDVNVAPGITAREAIAHVSESGMERLDTRL